MTETKEPTLWVAYCYEEFGEDGPLGTFREALEISVRDYGNNVLWTGKPGEKPSFRVPTKIVAEVAGQPVTGGDTRCDYSVVD